MSEEKESADRLLTLDDLLEMLPLAKGTIYRYTSQGRIPHLKIGNRLVFRESEILGWLERQRA